MATSVEPTRRPQAPEATVESQVVTWLVEWVKRHRQATAAIVAVLLLAGGLLWWNAISEGRTEAAAGEQLGQARLAFESRNYPLAASELSRIVENYSGTRAAEEANLILAQVRLYQGQPQQAIDQLTRFAPSAGRNFRAQAYGLLGAAQENGGHWKEAGEAYEQGAKAALFPFLKAQYLSDAGRVWAIGGDTARAVGDYRTIATKLDSTSTAIEAKVRLGELTRGMGAK